MTTQTKALKLALEGVEIHSPNSPEYIVCDALIQALAQTKHNPVGFYDAENKDLRREIPMGEDGDWWQPVYTHPPVPTAQPEHEPVAFPDAPQTIYLQVGDECPEEAKWKELVDVCWCEEQVFDNDIVYVRADTTPPKRTWVGLTDDEMWNVYANGSDIINLDYAKAIEAKLKEKNT